MPKFLNDVSIYTPAGNLTLSGDTITSADDLNIVATGNDITVDTDNFTITSSASNKPKITLESTIDAQVDQAEVQFYKSSASQASEDIGTISWHAWNSEATKSVFAEIHGVAASNTVGSEFGKIFMSVRRGGGVGNVVVGESTAADKVDVSIASGVASTTTIAGDLDIDGNNMTTAGAMTLTTGGAYIISTSSGNITLDSAGDIALGAAGNDVTVDADNFSITSSSNFSPVIELLSTSSNALSSILKFNKQQADNSPENANVIGLVTFAGEDANGIENFYGSIGCSAVEVDAGDEAGRIDILVSNDGTTYNGISMAGDKATAEEVDVIIANGAGSRTTIAGDLKVTTGLLLDGADITTIQTDGETFADNNSSLMTSGAIADYVAANGSGVDFASEAEVEAGIEASKAISPDTLRDGAWNRTIGLNVGTTPGDGHGDVVTWGSIPSGGAIVGGGIYYYSSTSEWVATDANTANSAAAKGLLGVALGTTIAEGILLRGTVCLVAIEGTEVVGSPLFLSGTGYTATADTPAGDGDTVRIVGHLLSSTNNIVYFNPDNTFVEVTA